MPLRRLLIPVLGLAGLVAACDNESVRISSTHIEDGDAKGALKVVETLQCPKTLGSLTRKGTASAEGQVCIYVGPRGAEVSLHLVKIKNTTPVAALKAFEDRLSTALPLALAELRAPVEPPPPATATDGSGDRASVRAPGVNIQTDGEDASVRLPGIRIESKGDAASVQIGGFHVDANAGDETVRMNGEADGDAVSIQADANATEVRTRAGGEATRATWILADNRPSAAGWRLVGYEARGPAGGPLVVATVRSRDRERDSVFEDAKALVTLNVGE